MIATSTYVKAAEKAVETHRSMLVQARAALKTAADNFAAVRSSGLIAMDLAPGDRILDVCGGTADLSIMAARRIGTDGFCAVYDINHAMLEAGRPKLEALPWKNRIQLIQGDAEKITLSL